MKQRPEKKPTSSVRHLLGQAGVDEVPVLLALLVGQRVANHLAQLSFLHLEAREESDLELFAEVTMVVQWSAGYVSSTEAREFESDAIWHFFFFPFSFSFPLKLNSENCRSVDSKIKLNF